MKRSLLLIAGLLLAAVLLARLPEERRIGTSEGAPPRITKQESVTVLFVPDGDTVKVRWRGREEWVRLLRIDTPERDEKGYTESRAALRAFATGKGAAIIFENPEIPERDRHERLLAYLFVDGRNLNVEMVRSGWSTFWTRYGEGRFASSFRRAEKEARRARRGLWGNAFGEAP